MRMGRNWRNRLSIVGKCSGMAGSVDRAVLVGVPGDGFEGSCICAVPPPSKVKASARAFALANTCSSIAASKSVPPSRASPDVASTSMLRSAVRSST